MIAMAIIMVVNKPASSPLLSRVILKVFLATPSELAN